MYQPILPWTDTFSSAQRQVFWLADFLPAPSRQPFGGSGNDAGVSSVYSGGDRAGFSPCLPYSPGRLFMPGRAPFGLHFFRFALCRLFYKETTGKIDYFYLTPSPMACQRTHLCLCWEK